jgi:hypothetical protein
MSAAAHVDALPELAVVTDYARVGKDEVLEAVLEGDVGLFGFGTAEGL